MAAPGRAPLGLGDLVSASAVPRPTGPTGIADIVSKDEIDQRNEFDQKNRELLDEASSGQAVPQVSPEVVGAIQAMPDTVTTSSDSRQVRKALLNEQEANKRRAELEADLRQGTEDREAALGRLTEIESRTTETVDQAVERLQQTLDGLGDRAPALRRQVASAQSEFARIKDEVQRIKPDPGRLLSSMPTWAQATAVIGASIDTLARTLGSRGADADRSTPSVFNLVNAAMQKDFDNQRQMLQSRMAQLGIADRERRFALGRLDALQDQQRQQAELLTRTQLAGMVANENSIAKQMAAVRELGAFKAGIRGESLRVDELSRDQVTRNFQSHKSANAAKANALTQLAKEQLRAGVKAQKADPAEVREDDRSLETAGTARSQLLRLAALVKKQRSRFKDRSSFTNALASKGLAKFWFGTDAALQGELNKMTTQLARASGEKGPLSDTDIKRFADASLQILSTDSATRQAGVGILTDIMDRATARAESAARRGRVKSVQDFVRLRNQIIGDIENIEKQFQ